MYYLYHMQSPFRIVSNYSGDCISVSTCPPVIPHVMTQCRMNGFYIYICY
jgi:hypothetical protein